MRAQVAVVCLAIGMLAAAGCAGSTSSASPMAQDAPLPTIGLGSKISSGEVSAGAEARVVGSSPIDTVVMIGDSITVASKPALQEVFEQLGFDGIVIESKEGKRTAQSLRDNPSGAEVATALRAYSVDADDRSNELWVVALGTNDISQYSDPAERAAVINEMLGSVPEESPLVWVDTYFADRPEDTEELNSIIEDRVRSRGNAAIARWSDVAADDGNLRNDGVHPREQGSIIFANTVAATIVDFLQLD
jgi:lysophospholipase L1-like esterase